MVLMSVPLLFIPSWSMKLTGFPSGIVSSSLRESEQEDKRKRRQKMLFHEFRGGEREKIVAACGQVEEEFCAKTKSPLDDLDEPECSTDCDLSFLAPLLNPEHPFSTCDNESVTNSGLVSDASTGIPLYDDWNLSLLSQFSKPERPLPGQAVIRSRMPLEALTSTPACDDWELCFLARFSDPEHSSTQCQQVNALAGEPAASTRSHVNLQPLPYPAGDNLDLEQRKLFLRSDETEMNSKNKWVGNSSVRGRSQQHFHRNPEISDMEDPPLFFDCSEHLPQESMRLGLTSLLGSQSVSDSAHLSSVVDQPSPRQVRKSLRDDPDLISSISELSKTPEEKQQSAVKHPKRMFPGNSLSFGLPVSHLTGGQGAPLTPVSGPPEEGGYRKHTIYVNLEALPHYRHANCVDAQKSLDSGHLASSLTSPKESAGFYPKDSLASDGRISRHYLAHPVVAGYSSSEFSQLTADTSLKGLVEADQVTRVSDVTLQGRRVFRQNTLPLGFDRPFFNSNSPRSQSFPLLQASKSEILGRDVTPQTSRLEGNIGTGQIGGIISPGLLPASFPNSTGFSGLKPAVGSPLGPLFTGGGFSASTSLDKALVAKTIIVGSSVQTYTFSEMHGYRVESRLLKPQQRKKDVKEDACMHVNQKESP